MVACSSDDPETDTGNGNGNGGNAEAPYVWGAEGAIKTCDHLLFDDDKTENAKGTVIGMEIRSLFLRVHRLCPKELT